MGNGSFAPKIASTYVEQKTVVITHGPCDARFHQDWEQNPTESTDNRKSSLPRVPITAAAVRRPER